MTAPGDDVDQDAMAAAWEAAMDPDSAPAEATGEDGDDLAAEWAAMLDTGGGDASSSGGGGRESTRVLNQDEIDSLLGFDDELDDFLVAGVV